MVKTEIWELVGESLQKIWVFPTLNATFLTLISKEKGVTNPGKFWPISLCNVIYKIITKVIVNRLKTLLPLLISPEQIGYVKGRKIIDGIILAHEITHSLNTTKKYGILIKLDLSKAFDKLSWEFIEKMLLDFGSSKYWTKWILTLTSSVFSLSWSMEHLLPLSPLL